MMDKNDEDFVAEVDKWISSDKDRKKATSGKAADDENDDSNSNVQEEQELNVEKVTQAQRLIEYSSASELFHTPNGDCYARIQIGNHWETIAIKSRSFKSWLTQKFYSAYNQPPNTNTLKDAISVLEAKAEFDGETIPVHIRVAGKEGNIYIDLCNEKWQAVEVSPDGWRIVDEPPVRFKRTKGMLPLPNPEPTIEKLDDLLRPFLNYGMESNLKLIVGYAVGACCPDMPNPVLTFQGEHGTAKSTNSRVCRGIIDPVTAPLRSVPKDERDIAISAANSWVIAYDNLSGLSPQLSDTICKLSTGGAFATRKLHTDDEEALFSFRRPVIINGIDAIATRQDLVSRSMLVELPLIPEEKRIDEATFWSDFDKALPKILGALLNTLSGALKALPDVQLNGKPRMADFAKFVTAAEASLGWQNGSFMKAYSENTKEAINQGLDADPFATAVMALMENRERWEGTPRQFVSQLLEYVDDHTKRYDRSFPKENKLKNAFKRSASALRAHGIEYIELPRENTRRPFQLLKVKPSPLSLSSNIAQNLGLRHDDTYDDGADRERRKDQPSSHNDYKEATSFEKASDFKGSDGSDSSDDTSHHIDIDCEDDDTLLL